MRDEAEEAFNKRLFLSFATRLPSRTFVSSLMDNESGKQTKKGDHRYRHFS
jgi:hypothetical protein